MNGDRIGSRIAALRNARGLTARALADKAHVSLSLLTKVESGHAPATPALIGAVARALRTDVPRITGQPYEPGSARSRVADYVDPIRGALAEIDEPTDEAAPAPQLDQLTAEVRHVSELGQRADYVALGENVPVLLTGLAAALRDAPESDQPALQSLLAEAYSGASAIATLLGYLDLRDRLVDRIEQASAVCDDPLRPPRVAWQRSATLTGMGKHERALTLMDRTRDAMGDPAGMTPRQLSVYGSTHLRSAYISARSGSATAAATASAHLDAARELAERTGDRNDYGLAFGPSNVAQHELSTAVDLEDTPRAVHLARTVRLPAHVPPVRRSYFEIDAARAALQASDHAAALTHLGRARRIAPQQIRNHPMVRETVLAIAAAGRGTEELTRFADWLGLA